MTLVAVFEVNGIPFLIGDIIVGREDYTGPQTIVPTRIDLDEILPRDWYRGITGVRRKLAVINKNLVVGWAGRSFVASAIIGQLKEQFEDKQAFQEDLYRFFEKTEDFGKGFECIIIGWLVDEQEKTVFKWDSATRTFSTNLPGYVIGSGAIGTELKTGHGLQQLYGGGIEIIYFDNGEFKQLENVTYLFWSIGIFDKSIGVTMEPLQMTYRYLDDVLVIRSERLEAGKQINGFKSKRTALTDNFIILPVYKHKPHFDVDKIETFTRIVEYFCNFCVVQFPDGNHKLISFPFHSPDNSSIMRFKKLSKEKRIGELKDIIEILEVDMERFSEVIHYVALNG